MPNSKILKAAAEELAKRANQGDNLAMDYASRMQRAKDMGFDTSKPVYHGTATDFEAFDPAKKSSANLLASKGAGFVPVGGALAVGAGLTPEEAMAEQAKSEYLHGIGGSLEHKIEAPSSPLLYSLADKIGQADRATQGHPANLLIPTGLGDWARKASFDEADWSDRVWAAMDIIP